MAESPPLPIVGDPLRNPPALFRLTTGRAKLRGGGIAAVLPALAPSMVVRVGRTSSDRLGDTLLKSFGETLMLFRATGRELTSVSRDTAVNPLRARMLA
jgi:hypothetical protein